MDRDGNFQLKLIQEIVEILSPLKGIAISPTSRKDFFRKLGWNFDQDTGLQEADLLSGIENIVISIDKLQASLANPPQSLADFKSLLCNVNAIFSSIKGLKELIDARSVNDSDYTDDIAEDLIHYLLSSHIENKYPTLFHILRLINIIQLKEGTETLFSLDNKIIKYPFSFHVLTLDPLGQIFTDLGELFKETYIQVDKINTSAEAKAISDRLFTVLGDLIQSMGGQVLYGIKPTTYGIDFGSAGNEILNRTLNFYWESPIDDLYFGARIVISSAEDGDLGCVITPFGQFNVEYPAADYLINIGVNAVPTALAIKDNSAFFDPDSASQQFSGKISISKPSVTPALAIGSSTGTRLEIADILIGASFDIMESKTEFDIHAAFEGARFIIDAQGQDSFLSGFIPDNGIVVDLDFLLGYSTTKNVYFGGSVGLEYTLPIHRSVLGFLDVSFLYLGLRTDTSKLVLEASVSGGINLGPFIAQVEKLGLNFNLDWRRNDKNLGLVHLTPGLKPPNGLSLAIDTDIITGGGFIELDPDRGRYSGILQLELFDIGISAIGILDTKDNKGNSLPPPGFSFLIIILADLPMVQLGFGFTLNGVGGLIGVHRTTQPQTLQNRLREGAVGSILFPENPLQNLPRIVSDIRDIFPTQMDQFIFGPMLQIGWGTPTIFEIELALILDLPDPVRLILLGQLHVVLPSEKFPVAVINVDLVGILDFGRKLIYIEANVRDSRLAGFQLTGGMAFYLNWGREADFILSIGGFHPAYANAPNLPAIDRLGISLSFGDVLYIGVEGYFAVTSNSIQFGARAELFLGVDEVNIRGWMSFDALLTFSPFYFRFDFTYGFTVNIAGKTLAGISFSGTLEGPNPFRIYGEGCISILFIDICIDFDFTIGEKKAEDPLPIKDPWKDLLAAIQEPANWEALLPSYAYLGVNVSIPKDLASLTLVHPMGQLRFMQQVVPLNRKLEKFGEFSITEQDHFNVISVMAGNQLIGRDKLKFEQAHFAAGQYEYLSVQQKLGRESFELMDAGLDFTGQSRVDAGENNTRRTLDYEQCIINNPNGSREITDKISFDEQEQLGDLTGKHRNSPLTSGRAKYVNPNRRSGKLALQEEAYQIAFSIDQSALPNQMLSNLVGSGNRTEKSRRLDQLSVEFPEYSKYLTIKKSTLKPTL